MKNQKIILCHNHYWNIWVHHVHSANVESLKEPKILFFIKCNLLIVTPNKINVYLLNLLSIRLELLNLIS